MTCLTSSLQLDYRYGRFIQSLKNIFYKEDSDVTREYFLTTKFALWIDTRSSIDNTLHGSVRAVEKSGILLQIEKAPEISGGDLNAMCLALKM